MTKVKILGLDPALRNTGVAIAEYCLETGKLEVTHLDIIRTEKAEDVLAVRQTSDDLKCAKVIVQGIRRIVAEHKPAFVASEISSFSQSARGMFTNGVCCGVLASVTLPILEVSALEVKKAAGGAKGSSKEFVIQWAMKNWPEAGWMTRKVKGETKLLAGNEHLADACGAIAAGILTPQFAQAISIMQSIAVNND